VEIISGVLEGDGVAALLHAALLHAASAQAATMEWWDRIGAG
jgi:hypothetical protein